MTTIFKMRCLVVIVVFIAQLLGMVLAEGNFLNLV